MSDFKPLSRSVKGLTVLVTGAASGMGRATARVFAAEGAHLAVTDFDAEVAHMTLSLCLPAASFLPGAVIPVDGGLMARNA